MFKYYLLPLIKRYFIYEVCANEKKIVNAYHFNSNVYSDIFPIGLYLVFKMHIYFYLFGFIYCVNDFFSFLRVFSFLIVI